MKRTHYPTLLGLAGLLLALAGNHSMAQTLPVTTGLQLWLKADAGITTNSDGAVTRWADQSGNANDALQPDASKAPALESASLNGIPTLRFPGSTKFLDVASSSSLSGLADDVTILVLVKYDDLNGGYRCGVSKTQGNGPAPFDWWNNQSADSGRTHFWLGNGNASQNTGFISTAAPQTGIYNVMGFKWGGGTVEQYLNDVSNGTFSYSMVPADTGSPLRIGSRGDLVTQLKGNMAEVLIYQPALSPSDVTAVIGYLRSKYNLAFNLPPSVSITTPTSGISAATFTPLTVNIQAADPDGSVARVDLLNHGQLVASMTKSPYQTTLNAINPGTATFTAIATDNLGRAATSSPVVVTITGTAPSVPVVTGLKVWLRADAGVSTNTAGQVTQWADQSGTANDAASTDVSTAPSLVSVNRKPVIQFAPSDSSTSQFLEVPDSGTEFVTGDFSTFVTAQFADFAAYRVLWTKASSGLAAPFDWWFHPDSGQPNAYRGDGVNFRGPVAGTVSPAPGQFTTIGLTVNGKLLSHYLGSADNGSGTLDITPADGGTPLRIGSRDDGATQMQGGIGEILIYDHALSITDRSNVVCYLESRIGLADVVLANQSPQVSITSPTSSTTLTAPGTTTFAVSASDSDGTVSRVDLLANGSLLVSLTNSPYEAPLDVMTPGSITLQAVAVDNWGAKSTSAPVALKIGGTTTFQPPTTDLRLWLRADAGVQTATDGTLTVWSDQSGNANDAAPGVTSPTLVANALNGKPAVRFNGSDNYLDVASSASVAFDSGIASYAVVRFDDYATYRALWSKTSGNQPASVDYYLLPGSGTPRFYRGNGAGASGSVDASQGPDAGVFAIVGFEMSGTLASHYLNGFPNGSGQITAPMADGGSPLRIGSRDDLATILKGDLAELLIFGHGLTDTDRANVLSYLGGKYGFGLVRLGNHPPIVTLTTPVDGAVVSAPGTLDVIAQVTDNYSSISQVDFLADGVVVGSSTTAPYHITLQLNTPGTLSLQARATDLFGVTGTSDPINVKVTGNGPSDPPANGLVLWLKADAGLTTNSDGSVATWADQSSQGNNALESAPNMGPVLVTDTATGKPLLQFDGSGQSLDITSAPSLVLESDIAAFCVVNPTDVSTSGTLWCKTQGGRAYPWNYTLSSGGKEVIVRGDADGSELVASATPLGTGRSAVIGFGVEGSFATHYLNGQTNGTGVFGYGAGDQGGPLRIGLTDDSQNPLKSKLGELLVYNRNLSGADLQQVNRYLAAKYGVVVVTLTVSRPTLSLVQGSTGTCQLSWPSSYSGYVLETRSNIATGTWTPVATNPPGNTVTVSATNVTQFFRLRSQ